MTELPPLIAAVQEGGICSSWSHGSGRTSVDGQMMTRWSRHAGQRELHGVKGSNAR